MKPNLYRNTTIAAFAALALAGSASVGLAADIKYNFDSDVQGWYAADAHGNVVWDSTHNRGGSGGCLKYTIVAGTDTEIDPRVNVEFDTTGYFSVEFDMMVDPASGTGTAGNYGNLQIIARDSSWSWNAMWYGAVGTNFNTWRHVQRTFTSAYGLKAYLQMQISPGDITGGDIIVYIDNVVIRDGTPPNQAVLFGFEWPEQCVPQSSWGAGPPVFSQDKTLNTNGCLKEVANYGSGNTGWQDAPAQMEMTWDPSKFTYIDFDLYLDAPAGLPSYGQYQMHYLWGWGSVGTVGLSAANLGKWTHYSLPLPALTGTSAGLVLHPGGNNMSGTFTYYLANVTLWKPATPPTLQKLVKGTGVGGVQITMNDNASQWQRDAIVTSTGTGPYFWASQGVYPVSYSFTITNFPTATARPGLSAHMFLVNGSSDNNTAWSQTYGGCDWNVPDIFKFSVENAATGSGAIARISWKTNSPNANPPGDAVHQPVAANATSVVGTWTLTFTSPTNGSVTGPGLTATNFTLPEEAVIGSFMPALDYIQFGVFKNDGANDGHNNQASGTFGEVLMTVDSSPVFQDNFPGPGLQANYAWRTTSSTAVLWTPPDAAWWLTWSLPDDGFMVEIADSVTGPYVDAGVTYTYTVGATKTGAIPAANVPPGNSAFIRMMKP